MLNPNQRLLEEILAFCKEHRMPQAEFGIRALNQRGFISKLRCGLDCRLTTAERVREFMALEAAHRRTDRVA